MAAVRWSACCHQSPYRGASRTRREFPQARSPLYLSGQYQLHKTNRILLSTGGGHGDWQDPFGTSAYTGDATGAAQYQCAHATLPNTSPGIPNYCSRTTAQEEDAGGTVLSYQQHYYYGSPVNPTTLFPSGWDFSPWMEGREFRTTVQTTASGPILRDERQSWQQRASVYWWAPNTNPDPVVIPPPPGDPRLWLTDAVMDDGQVSRKISRFSIDAADNSNNVTAVEEYGFGSPTPGSLVRKTTTTFQLPSRYTSTPVHLRSLPATATVYDGAATCRLPARRIAIDEGFPRPHRRRADQSHLPGDGGRPRLER